MKIKSKKIVIDTSIARSAGGKKSVDPQSTRCRKFLEEVLSICHKAVFNKDLKEEWEKHQSRFARTWMVMMKKRGKLVEIKRSKHQKIRAGVKEYAPHRSGLDAMMKDIFLVELAVKTDMIIATRDTTVINLFEELSEKLRELRDITWLNPYVDYNEVLKWLETDL